MRSSWKNILIPKLTQILAFYLNIISKAFVTTLTVHLVLFSVHHRVNVISLLYKFDI